PRHHLLTVILTAFLQGRGHSKHTLRRGPGRNLLNISAKMNLAVARFIPILRGIPAVMPERPAARSVRGPHKRADFTLHYAGSQGMFTKGFRQGGAAAWLAWSGTGTNALISFPLETSNSRTC